MKLNADKCHLLILGRNSNQQVTLNIEDSVVENTEEEKLLGVAIDKKLTFDTHISKLCKKAGSKLFALARIAGYMDRNKLRILMRAFVISQLQCCPLVLMFNSRHLNNKFNGVHERALRIAHKDYQSIFNVLLENDCSVNMQAKNLQTLVTEMLKTTENLNPPFKKGIFCERSAAYNLRNNNYFLPPRVRKVSYRTETFKYREQRLWVTLPQYIRNTQSINGFKIHIKNSTGADCTCRLCRVFVPQLGFLGLDFICGSGSYIRHTLLVWLSGLWGSLIAGVLPYHHVPEAIQSLVTSLYTDFHSYIISDGFSTPAIQTWSA